MVSKDLPVGIQIAMPLYYCYLVGLSQVRVFLYTEVIIWVNTILYHIDARTLLPRYKGSCMTYYT